MVKWVRFVLKNDLKTARIGVLSSGNDTIEEYTVTSDHYYYHVDAQRKKSSNVFKASDVKLLAPLEPRSVIALWNNFHERAKKEGQQIPSFPLYFMKPISSVVGPYDNIVLPHNEKRVIEEAELGVIIGKKCHRVSEEEAWSYIFGYTCVNDVTAVDTLFENKAFQQWTRSKGYDTFTPMGPSLLQLSTAAQHVAIGKNCVVKAKIDGEVKQNYNVNDMIFSPLQIVSKISHAQTLFPGDVIACGTSIGASVLKNGSVCDIEIETLGKLTNNVAAENPASSKL